MANPFAFGSSNYHEGALARLNESKVLLDRSYFSGSAYLAGRGVESFLRAVIWKGDQEIRAGKKSLETGHDLVRLLQIVGRLGLLQANARDDDFRTDIQFVSRLWFNNMRFSSNTKIDDFWRSQVFVTKRTTLKRAATEFFDRCQRIAKRCEVLLQQS